jgi:hypothetical protein
MLRAILLFGLVAASGIACAASVTLNFTTPGPRLAWIAPGPLADPPESARKTERFEIELETTGHAPSERIYVLDESTGNIAERPLKEVSDSWTVETPAFKRIAMVRLRVESGGAPVSAANVTVSNAGKSDEFLLDPSMRGVIRLPLVSPPELTVRIRYNRDGKPSESKQVFPVALKRSEPVPELVASVSGAVTVSDDTAPSAPDARPSAGTEGSAAADASKPKGEKDSGEGGGFQFGNLLGFLLGLGIVIVGGYALLQYYNKNKTKVDAELENLGVQVPKPGDAPLTSGSPVPMSPPQPPAPIQKIQLDPSASVDPIDLPAPAPIAALVASPSLLSSQGDVIPLEPVTIVGREAGLGLSLTSESTVSRKHAELRLNGHELVVIDLGSSNGTYINGQRISAPTPVRSGDRVQFGEVVFRFEAPRS